MKKFYEVSVMMTGKAVGSKDGFSMFDNHVESFATVAAAKAYIKERYGKCKRDKIYVDVDTAGDKTTLVLQDGHSATRSKHIGYVYKLGVCRDMSHAASVDNQPWYQQDWVEVREVQSTTIII